MAYINGKEIFFSPQVHIEADAEGYEELAARNEELQTQNEQLQTQNENLKRDNENLEEEIEKANNDYMKLYAEKEEAEDQAEKQAAEVVSLIENTITEYDIPRGVSKVGTYAFHGCTELTQVTIPSSVDTLENYAFQDCSKLSNVIMENGVRKINRAAFRYCSALKSFTMPHTVTVLNNAVFEECTALEKVTVSKQVTTISSDTFKNCTACLEYDFLNHESVPTLANVSAFSGINAAAVIKVPAPLYSEWIAATNWASLAAHIVADNSRIAIPNRDITKTANVNVAVSDNIGFWFSDTLAAGEKYVEHSNQNGTATYLLSECGGIMTIEGSWNGDGYFENDMYISGEYLNGSITFLDNGTFKIYRKCIDDNGNEYKTASYIYEVDL